MPEGEYVVLESDEQHTVPDPHRPRRRHARVDVPDRFRRRVLSLAIIDYFYLVVCVQRAQSVSAEYVLDLRFVDPSVRRSRHVATWWLIATLVLVALAVASGLRVQGSAAPVDWLVACLIASTLAVAAGFVCAYRTTETLAVFSIHGRARLFEHTGMLGLGRALRPFLVKLAAHVRIAAAARRPSKALHLRDEMREHARLHETGVLSKREYEAGKVRILAEHAPGGGSAS
ncbi:MAG TPA: hypothetical protein VFU13_17395 [Steroidobacteraceae bacterium]|nr:hypothetical protein [Steroidobacteraceae bacterium]